MRKRNVHSNYTNRIMLKEFVIKVQDDQIHCTKFSGNPTNVVIFAPGVGIRKTFYYPFLEFVNKMSFTVFTLDYRGISQSQFRELKDYRIKLIDWIADIKALIQYTENNYPNAEFFYIAHSYGGQIYGFLPTNKFARAVMITSQNGYWKYYRDRTKLHIFWKFVAPVLTWLFGYLPAKRLGLGGDLPKGVTQQWRKWCLSPNYLFDDDKLKWKEQYAAVQTPILAFAVADDEYGGEPAVKSIQDHYANSTIVTLEPKNVGVERIGHIGFFRLPQLWQEVVDWLKH